MFSVSEDGYNTRCMFRAWCAQGTPCRLVPGAGHVSGDGRGPELGFGPSWHCLGLDVISSSSLSGAAGLQPLHVGAAARC